MTRVLGVSWLAWCAFRDACGLVSLALAVPPSHAPGVWAFFVVRVAVAAAAAWGLARRRRWGLGLAVGYLAVIAVALFAWMVWTDPVSTSWASSVWSWPVLALLARAWRRAA
jgi:hypothetical protein